ncbi:MAG: threonine/serine exporter family protein [Acidimicrobiia bacterium]|nr:threonine/serine exporter family protein [Acidimicrobiia bacterium]
MAKCRRACDVMLRLAFLSLVGSLVFLGVPFDAAVSSAVADPVGTISSGGSVASSPVREDRTVGTAPTGPPATSEPESRGEGVEQESTTTSAPESPGEGVEQESTTTSEPESRGEGVEEESTTTSEPESLGEGVEEESTTTSTSGVIDAPVRPGTSPQVSDSHIPLGSIVLALLVLASVGVVSYVLLRRRPVTPTSDEAAGPPSRPADGVVDRSARDRTPLDPSTSDFLIGLGEALMDAGASVGHVESALRAVARANGTDGVGVVVLPTALIVSVPDCDDVVTEIGAPGRALLRLDQIDDVLRLVREAESGAIGASEGNRRLAEIRSAGAPYSPRLVLVGYICATVGLAAILHATWVEVVAAALLGAVVGAFRLWTRHLSPSYQPFVVLIAATAVSTTVFALTRVMDDLLTFPLLIAPLITFLPGGLLTIATLELATGQIVSGASRLASGGLQLILLALGILAGSQLVGLPARELGSDTGGTVAVLTPWIGVAVFGIGVVWFYGARSSARVWILLVLYVAYAAQVIGGLFFGSALSAFFGALAMTPVAVLAARRPAAPSPLVTFLPGFWLLVPGALGLDGVTRLFGAGGASAAAVLVTTATSMVGVSLGILLGLLLAARDPERPWSESRVVEPARSSPKQSSPRSPPTAS